MSMRDYLKASISYNSQQAQEAEARGHDEDASRWRASADTLSRQLAEEEEAAQHLNCGGGCSRYRVR